MGPEPLLSEEGNWHTVAWRSYNPWRGKGLMKDFTRFALDIYQKTIPEAKFWAILKKENYGSAGLASALGFEKSEKLSDDVSLVFIK